MTDQRQLRVDTAIAEYLESKDYRTPFAEAEWLDRFDDVRDELLAFVRDESLFGNRDLEETAAFAPATPTGMPVALLLRRCDRRCGRRWPFLSCYSCARLNGTGGG